MNAFRAFRISQWWFVALFACVGLPVHASEMPELRLISDVYCPYTCAPESQRPGYVVELVQRALADQPVRVEYRITPWERAFALVASGQADGLLAVSERRAGDLLLSSVIGYDQTLLTGLARVSPPDPGSGDLRWLDSYRLGGVLSRHPPETPFERYLVTRRAEAPDSMVQATGEHAVSQLVRLLTAGRVDAVFENGTVMRYNLFRLAPDLAYWQVPIQASRALHIGLKDTPTNRRWLEAFERGLAAMRANGELVELMAGYGLADWLEQPEHMAPADALGDSESGTERDEP